MPDFVLLLIELIFIALSLVSVISLKNWNSPTKKYYFSISVLNVIDFIFKDMFELETYSVKTINSYLFQSNILNSLASLKDDILNLNEVTCRHRRRVIEANEAVAYPVFGHAVEL